MRRPHTHHSRAISVDSISLLGGASRHNVFSRRPFHRGWRCACRAAKMEATHWIESIEGRVGAMTVDHQHVSANSVPSASHKVKPVRRRLRLFAVGGLTLLGAFALSVGLAPAASVGADILVVDPSLPTDPATVPTTVPDTTPPTTAAPPTSTTTAPSTTTSQPTTTTSRTTTHTTDGGGTSTPIASGTSTSAGVRLPAAKRKVLAAPAKRAAVKLRGASPLPNLAQAQGGSLPVDVSPRVLTRKTADNRRPTDVTQFGGTATAGAGSGNSLMALGLILAGTLLLGVAAWRFIAGRRRRRLRAAFGAPLFVDRDATEIEVRAGLIAMLADGPIDVSGSDCRSLQMLVKVAALEGLEIRDTEGYVSRASETLVVAYGFVPDRKRLPLHWRVTVGHRSVDIPDGAQYLMQETGPDGAGRRLAFTPGTPLDLWDGDCL